jgi:dihydrofolate synthase/folylpolyglutamate synthase
VLSEQPTVVVDAAHNTASAAALIRTLNSEFEAQQRILVFAVTGDKDIAGLLRQLVPQFETIILTQYINNPRAVAVAQLTAMFRQTCDRIAISAADPLGAWNMASTLATRDDLICITGSFFLAAEVRELIRGRSFETVRT